MLTGAKEIAAFMGRDQTHEIMEFIYHFGFPAKRNQEAVWVASIEGITQWLKDRNLTITSVNLSALQTSLFF